MLLTEDYFDNIEIKDEDINPNDLKDGFQQNKDDFKSLNEYNKSQYDCVLNFPVAYGNQKIKSDEFLNMVSKKLNYVFDSFDIKHSDVYVLSGFSVSDDDITIEHYENFISVINNHDNDSVYYSIRHSIRVYFKKPWFNNVKIMLKFVQALFNINQSTWGERIYVNIDFYSQAIDMFFKNKTDKTKALHSLISVTSHKQKLSNYLKTFLKKKRSVDDERQISELKDLMILFFGLYTWRDFINQMETKGRYDYKPSLIDKLQKADSLQ